MKKTIAVLVPVFNHLDFTKSCIDEMSEQAVRKEFKHCTYHIIVTDDGSTDGTGEWLEKHHPEVSVLQGDGNLWWSGGVNMAARYAVEELKASYLLLWNNDIEPAKDYYSQLDAIVGELEPDTIVGSKIFHVDERDVIFSYGGSFNSATGKKQMIGFRQKDGEEFMKPGEADWLPGMGTLIPVEVNRDIGYWDNVNFPQYHGDSDFTYRAKKAGYRIIVMPQLLIWNDKSCSGETHGDTMKGLMKTLFSTRSNYNIRKNFLFYRKHGRSPMAFLYLFRDYFLLVGGFIKWKFLGMFGIKRKNKN